MHKCKYSYPGRGHRLLYLVPHQIKWNRLYTMLFDDCQLWTLLSRLQYCRCYEWKWYRCLVIHIWIVRMLTIFLSLVIKSWQITHYTIAKYAIYRFGVQLWMCASNVGKWNIYHVLTGLVHFVEIFTTNKKTPNINNYFNNQQTKLLFNKIATILNQILTKVRTKVNTDMNRSH